MALEIAPYNFFLGFGQFFIPFASWRIIVRTRIRDRVGEKIVWKVRIISVTIEGETVGFACLALETDRVVMSLPR
jgi:hypothetical protein